MKKTKFLRPTGLLLSLFLTVGILAGCGSLGDVDTGSNTGSTQSEAGYPINLTDDLGNDVVINGEPKAVVSLAPSVTEILFAIGAEDKIVGRTDYCNYPPEAEKIESVGTFSSPNMELIISKSPDLVISSDFMDESIKTQLDAIGCAVYITHASDISGIKKNISDIGKLMGLDDNAGKVITEMDDTETEISKALGSVTEKKSAFFDLGSFYSAGQGSLIDSALNDISVTNIAADTGEEWPQLSVEVIVSSDPDVYISTFTSKDELKGTAGLSDLKCMNDENLLVLEFELADMIQRAGPRFAQAELELAKLIYPEAF